MIVVAWIPIIYTLKQYINGTKNIIVTAVNICPEDGIVDRSCFSEAQAFIYDIMRTRCVHDNHCVSTTGTKATMQTI